MLLEAIFSKQYSVVSASDGLAAMQWLSSGNKADLIITDMEMPNINGEELLDFLSGSYLYQDIPVVVISGFNLENLSALPVKYANVQSVSQKPFDPMTLMGTVSRILNPALTIAG